MKHFAFETAPKWEPKKIFCRRGDPKPPIHDKIYIPERFRSIACIFEGKKRWKSTPLAVASFSLWWFTRLSVDYPNPILVTHSLNYLSETNNSQAATKHSWLPCFLLWDFPPRSEQTQSEHSAPPHPTNRSMQHPCFSSFFPVPCADPPFFGDGKESAWKSVQVIWFLLGEVQIWHFFHLFLRIATFLEMQDRTSKENQFCCGQFVLASGFSCVLRFRVSSPESYKQTKIRTVPAAESACRPRLLPVTPLKPQKVPVCSSYIQINKKWCRTCWTSLIFVVADFTRILWAFRWLNFQLDRRSYFHRVLV